jgi:hypothetical protein
MDRKKKALVDAAQPSGSDLLPASLNNPWNSRGNWIDTMNRNIEPKERSE